MYSTLLVSFAIVTLCISLVYFYMFSRQQERFMQFWGFAWAAYSLSLLFLLLYLAQGHIIYLEIRKVIDMFNILLLLFGVYAFMHSKIPNYWYRFSLYLLLLSGVCVIYNFDLLSFYLPISLYQVAISISICYHIAKYWDMLKSEKCIALFAFALWGIGKPLLSLYEFYSDATYNLYIIELILSNILNFCILTLYAQTAMRNAKLKERLYENVVENAKDIIFYYRLKPFKSFQYITPSVEEITGYSQNKFYKNPRQFLDLVSPEYMDEIEDVLSGNLSYEKGNVFKIITKTGDSFWGEINSTVIEDDNGEPAAIECILRDITEMKSAQLEQIQAKRDRDLLLSYISHELRTPVTSIAGYLTALNDGIITNEYDKNEAMEIITDKTLTLKTLIDDLDQLSKLETNHFSFDFMICDVREFAEDLIKKHLPDIKVSGFNPIVEGINQLPDNCSIIVDEARINQVFGNLIGNAIKYSSTKTDIVITAKVLLQEEVFRVSVTDMGPGISNEEISHVFERFYRGHDTDKISRGGRGLGLTLSMEIMKSHNGDLTVFNNEPTGSTFTFTIPLYKEESNV